MGESTEFQYDESGQKIKREIEQNHQLFGVSHESLGDIGITDAVNTTSLRDRLAATDAFVEKAQYHLSRRAIISIRCAGFFLSLTVAISIGFVLFVDGTNQFVLFASEESTSGNAGQPSAEAMQAQIDLISAKIDLAKELKDIPGWLGTLLILQKLAIGTVFFAGIYLTSSFARALLHEATVLYGKRHALRFGRLFIYLSDGKITSEELFEAFGWNISPSTAFDTIRIGQVTKGLPSQISDALKHFSSSTAKKGK